jgi:hypothetical protein
MVVSAMIALVVVDSVSRKKEKYNEINNDGHDSILQNVQTPEGSFSLSIGRWRKKCQECTL